MTPQTLSSYFSTKNLGNLAAIIFTMRNSFRLRCLLAIAGSTYAEARPPLAVPMGVVIVLVSLGL
jgi:hypothetical protein